MILINKIKRLNYKNILIKIFNEIKNPRNRLIFRFINSIFSIYNFLFEWDRNGDRSLLIWDVRVNSITFDFLSVIFYTFNKIKLDKNNKFDIVIFTPESYNPEPFSFESYNKIVSAEDNKKRIIDLILPLAKSFSCIDKVIIESKMENIYKIIKNSNDVFPKNYHPLLFTPEPLYYREVMKNLSDKKVEIPYIKKENLNREIFNDLGMFINPQEYITLTLRDYGYMPHRNTSNRDIKVVYKFSLRINRKLIIVTDDIKKIKSYTIPEDVSVTSLPRKKMIYRNAIYSNSDLNIFKECGPAYLSHYIKNSKTIILDYCDGGIDSNLDFYKELYNLKIGDQPFLRLNGYLLWKDLFKKYKINDLMFAYKFLNNKNNIN